MVSACDWYWDAAPHEEASSLTSIESRFGDNDNATSQDLSEGSFGAVRFVAPEQLVYIAHVPKTGGMSLVKEVGKHVRPSNLSSCEHMSDEATEGAYVVTQLRIPRQHVVSQFMHCFERSGTFAERPHAFPTRIEDWVAHDFSDEPPKIHREPYYGCYQPLNMQGNFLTGGNVRNGTARELLALDALEAVDLVSVLELMNEMICVIHYAVHRAVSDEDCTCAGARPGMHDTHNVTHVPQETLSDDVRQRIDAITSADVPLYLAALARALASIRFVEEATGVEIFCDAERASLRETLHVGIPNFASRIKTSPHMTDVRSYLMQGASEARESQDLDA